jgi:ATP-dependent Clp protease, protease subunit
MRLLDKLPLPLPRKLYFSEQVDQKSIVNLTREIIKINDNDEYLKGLYALHNLDYNVLPIEIYIDSYGGQVYQILGLISVIENSVTPVNTIVTGCAMSCGFMLLISGHERFAHKHSTPLYHQVSSGSSGKIKDIQERYRETRRLQKKLEKLTMEKTNIPKSKLKKIYRRKQDWYMTPKEAVKYGVVDHIL